MTNNNERILANVIAAIVATGLMSFCGVIVETSMNVTFPILMHQFNVSTSTVQWMTSVYLLVVAVTVPLSAYLKATRTTKSLFLVANILFLIGVVIDAVAPAFGLLLLGRAVQGIGTGIALPLMFNIILEQVPTSKIGLMMGIGNLITGIAPAIGPTFGGLVANSLGWRWIFVFLLPLLVLSFILGTWGIHQKAALRHAQLDWLSCLFIVVLFSGLVFGFSHLSSGTFFSWSVGGALLIGLVGLIGLTWRSLTVTTPVLDLRLFANRRFAGHVFGFFCTQLMSLGYAFLLPNYIQLVNHRSSLIAGLIVLPAGVAGAIFAPLGGRLLDRYGARKPVLSGMGLCLVSLLIFSAIGKTMTNTMIMCIYVLYMAGMGTCMGTVMTSALQVIDNDQQAQGNAILNTLQQFAGAMGTSVAATIVAMSQRQDSHHLTLATAIGTQHAFFFLTVVCLLVWLTYWLVIPQKNAAD